MDTTFSREYRAGLVEGVDVSTLLLPIPLPPGSMPSPTLASLLHSFWDGRTRSSPAALVEANLPAARETLVQFVKPFVGLPEVPAVPVDGMVSLRGVGGYWVSWPGVDTSATAKTMIYYHGGEACGCVVPERCSCVHLWDSS